MATLLQDLRYALRTLRKSRGFTVVAVLTLALGIGATTAIFSVVDGVLLTPLPYEEPDELVMLWESNAAEGSFENVVSPANYFDWREQTTAFEGLAALADFDATLTGVGEPERVGLIQASANVLPLLGVGASVGRVYTAAEDVAGAPPVAVLSHGLWQRRFGGDPAVVGQTLTLDGEGVVVVGVLPEGFSLDLPQEILGSGSADVWVPLHGNAGDREWRGRFLQVVGRLKPGVSVAEAQSQMSTLARRLEQAYPEFQTGWDVNVVPLHQQVVGDVQEASASAWARPDTTWSRWCSARGCSWWRSRSSWARLAHYGCRTSCRAWSSRWARATRSPSSPRGFSSLASHYSRAGSRRDGRQG